MPLFVPLLDVYAPTPFVVEESTGPEQGTKVVQCGVTEILVPIL
jgi:hypothetical protein